MSPPGKPPTPHHETYKTHGQQREAGGFRDSRRGDGELRESFSQSEEGSWIRHCGIKKVKGCRCVHIKLE